MTEQLPYFERMRLIKLGLLPKEAVAKKKKPIKKVSDKKAKEIKEERDNRGGDETELTKWFRRCVKMMSGYCAETGLKTETKIFQYAVMSIAHLIPKSKAKSVATHPLNWIELNVDFHHKFDAMSWEEREKLGCWPIIHDRLVMIYPDLSEEDKRHFPESVLRYIENNEPFK